MILEKLILSVSVITQVPVPSLEIKGCTSLLETTSVVSKSW